MPNWNEILDEIKKAGSTHDLIRRKYLGELHEITGRNIIIYYSGWLQKPEIRGQHINDADKNGFMSVIHKLDRSLGLDLVLHTPGGETAATESIVDYLRAMFGTDIRVIVPQLAMSAGTMIACASKEIVMGKQSSLGPIDPQFNGIPAHGIVEEFNRAFDEIKKDQTKAVVWQPIIAKYNPTLIGECEKAVQWSESLVREWLASGMFFGDANADSEIESVIRELADHALNLNHARHISLSKAREIGLKVTSLEDNQSMQDAVLSLHHAAIHTVSSTNAFKIIENHIGTAFIQAVQHVVLKNS